MIEVMLQVHMTEAEAARDFHAVLERVREGAEVVIEQDMRPVAVIRTPAAGGRLLSECIALAEARGSAVTLDEGFIRDVEEGIASRSQPWNPPPWE
jgi:antitoxin (DNA-binding transcriptional repressor) of toxin-antitoxin stability system